MERDEKRESDAMTDQDGSKENGVVDGIQHGNEEEVGGVVKHDARDARDIDLNQNSETGDDVDLGVSVIGSRPAVVELDLEVDQNGEMDQDADVASEMGDSAGRDIKVAAEQRPEVDQRIEVDVEVSAGDDGTILIEIDAEVEDDVEIESDLDIDIDDDDEDSLDTEIYQDTESDGNIDVDVEVRDDLDAEVDVDIAALIETVLRGAVDIEEDETGTEINVDLDEKAFADGRLDVVVDLSDIDA